MCDADRKTAIEMVVADLNGELDREALSRCPFTSYPEGVEQEEVR